MEILKQIPHKIEALILNTVYSGNYAKELANEIPIVIGMTELITDKAAISFSEGFYKAIGGGKDFESAFEFGKLMMNLEDENLKGNPILIKKGNLPPTKHSRQ